MRPPLSLLHRFLFLAVTTNLPLAPCQALCHYFKYRAPGSSHCVKCPRCPPGQEITTHCGYTEHGKTGPACKPCIKGQTYSGKYSLECQLCRVYCPMGMRILKECTLTTDTECVKDCPPGSFVNSDGGCSKCSYCCGDNWQRSGFAQKACQNAAMGRCSCAPRRQCKPPQGTCLETTSTPPQTTTETVLKPQVSVRKPTSTRLNKSKRNRRRKRCWRKRKRGKKCTCNPKRKQRCKGKRKRPRKCSGKNKRKRNCKRKQNRRRKYARKLAHKQKRKCNCVSTPVPASSIKQIQAAVTRKRNRNRKAPLPAAKKVEKRDIRLFRF